MVDKKKKWQEIQGFCKEYIKLHGYPPTVREIADGVDLRSTGSVNSYMIEMYNNGMLISEPGKYGIPRAFRIPGMHISFDEDEIPVVTEKQKKQYRSSAETVEESDVYQATGNRNTARFAVVNLTGREIQTDGTIYGGHCR